MKPEESYVGNPIRSLQTMLRTIAAAEGRAVSIVPDGIYGPQTREEVSRFQGNRGLGITGVADRETWEAAAREYDDALARVGPAQSIEVILNPNQVLRREEAHHTLALAQGMLLTLHRRWGLREPPLSGVLDLATEEALRDFQALSGLAVTGELDRLTWKHLALQYTLASNL